MKKIFTLLWIAATMSLLHAAGDLHLFSAANKTGAITPQTIEKALNANGFTTAVNSEMNRPFTVQFKETNFKVFNLLTVYHAELAEALIKAYPDAGASFMPMGVGIYQGKDEDTIHVSILTAEAFEKILAYKSPIIKKIEQAAMAAVKQALPNAKHTLSEASLPAEGKLITSYELETDADSWSDAKDELQMMVEDGFKPVGFVMANYFEYNYLLSKEDTVESPFDFYDTYSICKLKVIYEVSKTRPEAAAFAPCTLVVYKKKDEDVIRMGFPAVYNWLSSAKVENKEAREALLKAQSDFESILKRATE